MLSRFVAHSIKPKNVTLKTMRRLKATLAGPEHQQSTVQTSSNVSEADALAKVALTAGGALAVVSIAFAPSEEIDSLDCQNTYSGYDWDASS